MLIQFNLPNYKSILKYAPEAPKGPENVKPPEKKSEVVDPNKDYTQKANREKLYQEARDLIGKLREKGEVKKADSLQRSLDSAMDEEKDPLEAVGVVAKRLSKRIDLILHPQNKPKLNEQQVASAMKTLDAEARRMTASLGGNSEMIMPEDKLTAIPPSKPKNQS
ncbi:hypothetical protein IT411_02435 [Candidatus Peregrinibacteria bacterium]|nr:hypothetical protein [Candidatus Peregrinibacteria bacterium]